MFMIDGTRLKIVYLSRMKNNTVSWKFTMQFVVTVYATIDEHLALTEAIKDSI